MLASCSGCGKTSMSLTWSMIQFPPASPPCRAREFLFFMSEMHSTKLVSGPETRWNVDNHVESTRSVTPVNRIRPRSGKGKTPGNTHWRERAGKGAEGVSRRAAHAAAPPSRFSFQTLSLLEKIGHPKTPTVRQQEFSPPPRF